MTDSISDMQRREHRRRWKLMYRGDNPVRVLIADDDHGLQPRDYNVIINMGTATGPHDIFLPPVGDCAGNVYRIVVYDTNDEEMTLNAWQDNGSIPDDDMFDGWPASDLALDSGPTGGDTPGLCISLFSDGTHWYRLSGAANYVWHNYST